MCASSSSCSRVLRHLADVLESAVVAVAVISSHCGFGGGGGGGPLRAGQLTFKPRCCFTVCLLHFRIPSVRH